MIINYEQAKKELLTSDFGRCHLFFEENGCYLELGYFYLLRNDLNKAKEEFRKVMDGDIRAHWAYFLVGLIEKSPSYNPTYFELRNFFEIDLNILLSHYKGDYIQTIVNYSDYLSSINSEICKYIGRVFYNHGFSEYAQHFFNEAKGKFYKDPELHFLIAELCRDKKDIDGAIRALETCLEILPEYFPAENMLKILRNDY